MAIKTSSFESNTLLFRISDLVVFFAAILRDVYVYFPELRIPFLVVSDMTAHTK